LPITDDICIRPVKEDGERGRVVLGGRVVHARRGGVVLMRPVFGRVNLGPML
jgi:hypothetical protein